MAETLVVVPCFNEAARLDTRSFVDFSLANPGIGFIFVDDGSTDATADVLARMCAGEPASLTWFSLPENRGKAEAVRAGLNKAFDMGARYAGYWDADLSTPLGHVLDFRAMLVQWPELLLVMGSRVRRLGTDIRRDPLRHYLGRVFATLASLALGIAVYDTQCGAKLMRVCDTVRAATARPFISKWVFDVEILARMRTGLAASDGALDRVFYELPLHTWRDVGGSKLKSSHMAGALLDLARIRNAYRASRNPR